MRLRRVGHDIAFAGFASPRRSGKASSAPIDHIDEGCGLKEHDGARDAPEQPLPAGPPQGPQEPNRQPEDDEVESMSGKRAVEKDRTSRATKHCGIERPGQRRPPFERDEPLSFEPQQSGGSMARSLSARGRVGDVGSFQSKQSFRNRLKAVAERNAAA